MTVARTLAERIAGTCFEQLTPAALGYARIGLLDTLGVGIAGAREDAAVIARRVSAAPAGPALVWGTKERVTAREAAFLNGIAANVLDFDDCTDNLGGHPSSPLLPALVALAEQLGASGRDLVTAYVAGFETETQLGRGVNFYHYEKGWHPTATLGVFGAAAGAARLLGLDADRTMHALAIAASMSAGLKSNLGSMVKPLHVGQAARNGLLAAELAAEGFTGNADALEHHQGFFEVFNGRGTYSAERVLAKWGDPWEIELPGIAVKQYPCCLSTQSAVDLMLQLVREHDLQPAQVERIRSRTPKRRLDHTNRPAPRSALDAKLSIQYVLARAVNDRAVTLEHFAGETYRDAAVRRLMDRVDAASFPDGEGPDAGAEIEVLLANGGRVAGRIERPIGHAAGEPISDAALAAKFGGCTRGALSPQAAAGVQAAVAGVGEIADVRRLTALMG